MKRSARHAMAHLPVCSVHSRFVQVTTLVLKAVGDPRKVVRDPEARYFGGRVEEHSHVPLGEARLGRIGLDEWLRSRAA